MPGSKGLGRRRHRGLAAVAVAVAALFAWTGSAQAQVFSNTTSIKIPTSTANGQSVPYPSTIPVAGLTGAVTSVTATLTGVSHTFPSDIDVLLVGPSGQNVVLLADQGGGTDITNVNLTFDSSVATAVPTPIVSGTFKPTAGVFSGTPPAPAAPYGTALTIFNGTVPNGTWSLYVFDDFAPADNGTIAGGWSLNITTNGPTVGAFAPTTGPAGTQVVIPGTNFTGATSVTFGGIPAAAFTVNSATQITATVPPGALSGPITVVTPTGSASSSTNYQVSPPPTITAFSPASGKVGDTITVSGTELTGATAVKFGGTPAATFAVTAPTALTAVVPAGAGAGPIEVTTAGGTGTSTTPFVVTHARTVSMSVAKRRVSGRVTATDSFSKCTAGQPVRIQRRIKGRWRNVGSTLTSATGAYAVSSTRVTARYRVTAAANTLSSGDQCGAAAIARSVRR
jgi:subtilisin-like proprotein convertase family protein